MNRWRKKDRSITYGGPWARKPTPEIKFKYPPGEVRVHMTNNGVEYGLAVNRIRGRTYPFMRKMLLSSLLRTLCCLELRDMDTTRKIYGLSF